MSQTKTKFQLYGSYNDYVLQNMNKLAEDWHKLRKTGYDHTFKFYTCGLWDDLL